MLFHRLATPGLPLLPGLLAVLARLHGVDGFFFGVGTLVLALNAFVGSNLLRCKSPAEGVRLSSLLKGSGWYSDAHC